MRQRITPTRPFAVTYHIREKAVWSDGVPVTADDFIFTYRVMVDPASNAVDRTGYSSITNAERLDDKKVRFTFDRAFAPWKTLFSTVLPQHVLEGRDVNTSFLNEIADPDTHVPIASGPYLVTSWIPGQSLTLTRNPQWWGRGPRLDSVVFRFPLDSASEVTAVASGVVDLIVPSASQLLLQLYTMPNVTVRQIPALSQEHLDFHVTSSMQTLLGETWFRQAVAHAIDRQALTQAVWGALAPGIQPLQSLVFYAQQPGYTPDFARYTYDPAWVAAIMGVHGCVRGPDGIWSCNGRRASLGITVASTNASRLFEETLIQQQARTAGIEFVPQNMTPSVMFGPTGILGGFYDSAIFAWVTGPDPTGFASIYRCGGPSNFTGYCSQPANDLLVASLEETDDARRTALLGQADALLADDVPSLPLFQRPQFVAYQATLHNVVDNASLEGPFWNLAEWWKG